MYMYMAHSILYFIPPTDTMTWYLYIQKSFDERSNNFCQILIILFILNLFPRYVITYFCKKDARTDGALRSAV